MELTSKQRAQLRGLAAAEDTIIQVGKGGINENLVASVSAALAARELVKGKVLQGNFNKNFFTKIDIRVDKEIKLYSKSAKILTMHPSSSYTLATDAKDQYVLRITNPQLFWSTSKYLVIQVK